MAERTGTISAIRGHMAEFGMVAAQRDAGLNALIAIIADADDVPLPALARELLALQMEHLRQVEASIAALDGRLVRQAREDEACRRLTEAPGIGPGIAHGVIATAIVATVGNARLFATGRSFAAMSLPLELDDTQREAVRAAIAEAFIVGYRAVMAIAAALALASAGVAWLMIRPASRGGS